MVVAEPSRFWFGWAGSTELSEKVQTSLEHLPTREVPACASFRQQSSDKTFNMEPNSPIIKIPI